MNPNVPIRKTSFPPRRPELKNRSVRFVLKQTNPFTLLGVTVLIPPTLCWIAILLALWGAGAENIWNFFNRVPEGLQILLLAVCPLLGTASEMYALYQIKKRARQ